MSEKIHQLRITPCDDGRGFWLVSNNRSWFMSRDMMCDLQNAINQWSAIPTIEWKNYEEPKPSPMPFSPPAKPTLEDLL